MMKRNKAILCALASIGVITSLNTINANAMTMTNNTNTTTKCIQKNLTASEVEKLMYDLPCTINTDFVKQLEDTVKIIDARIAYNTLPDNKKCYVDSGAVYNLKVAENTLKNVVKGEIKAINMACTMNQLKKDVGYKKNATTDEITIDKNKVATNEKRINDEIVYLETTYGDLDYSISRKLVKLMNNLSRIECKVAGFK